MIAIIESGSTKSDWYLLNSDKSTNLSHQSKGLNPIIINDLRTEISNITTNHFDHLKTQIEHIYFYGAGCSDQVLISKVNQALSDTFPQAKISVDSDLVGAVKAICHDKEGNVGILGTGSNACYFDGKEIIKKASGAGYLLGDEGSGFAIGKELTKQYVRGVLKTDHVAIFEKSVPNTESLINQIYSHAKPNELIASFAAQLQQWDAVDRVRFLVPIFEEYVENLILPTYNKNDSNINFVGSIAFHYQKELKQSLNSFSLQLGKILSKPIDELISYHLERL